MPSTICLTPAGSSAPESFRWSDVAANDRDWLRRRTEDARTLYYRVGCDFARLGVLLAEIRLKLRKRTFRLWLASETPFSRAHAYRLIAVGAAFGRYVSQIETLEPAALYLLSRPDVPEQVRAYAAELAESGERVTRATAIGILAAHKDRDPISRKDVLAHDDRMRGIRSSEKADRERKEKDRVKTGDETETERITRLAQLGAALESLVATCTLVHITTIDEDDGPPLYSVTTHREDDGPRNAVGLSLRESLERVAGTESVRRCPACPVGIEKSISAFGFVKGSPDGRNRYCRACERDRVKVAKRAAKVRRNDRAKSGTGEEPGGPQAGAPTP